MKLKKTISAGDQETLQVDWAAAPADKGPWLQPGENIASYDVVPAGGLTLTSKSISGAMVSATVAAPEDIGGGQKVSLLWLVTTDAAPPRRGRVLWEFTVIKGISAG